jgi:formylglycine-generating enzyme required for sulfatase activity
MAEIFISYKSERRSAAEHLTTILEHYGFSVWFDYRLIRGRDFGQQIDRQVREAKALVVLWCALSVDSRWVAEEADLAHELGILIPIKIEPCKLPIGFRRQDYIDLSSWDGAPRSHQLDPLIDALEQRLGRPAQPDRQGLRAYEEIWRRFGAPPLKAFAVGPPLAAVEADRQFPKQEKAPRLKLAILDRFADALEKRHGRDVAVGAAPISPERERALRPGDIFKECADGPEMVVVPAGSFSMGSPENEAGRCNDEGPQHRVTFAKPFAVGRFAVTFDEWDACAGDGGCNSYSPPDAGWGRGRQPVINVSWTDAKAYLAWLSRRTGKTYRLLSEAEREYVTRAATTTPFWWGSSISTNQANYDGDFVYSRNSAYSGGSKGEYRKKTIPVDSFRPNPWGLYQVHGNIWEWTEDCWNDSYRGAPEDGLAWTSGDCSRRVVRGGNWDNVPLVLRAACRFKESSGIRNNLVGFRVGRTLTP